jgi:putative DNA primase/helicase
MSNPKKIDLVALLQDDDAPTILPCESCGKKTPNTYTENGFTRQLCVKCYAAKGFKAQKMKPVLCKNCGAETEGKAVVCTKCYNAVISIIALGHGLSGDEVSQGKCTDTGNGMWFALGNYYDVVYVPEAKEWFFWNGKVWQKDEDGIEMMRRAKNVVNWMFSRAVTKFAKEDEKELRDAMLKWAKTSESIVRLKAMIESAKTTCRKAHYSDFDNDPWLFNAANCTINLKTGESHPHARRDMMTKLSPVEYDPKAMCPRWELFLREIMPQHEACCVPFIQRSLGYTMTGRIDEECFFEAWGSGRNGKTKLLETVQYIMGDYCKTASFDTFVVKHGQDKLNDIAGFKGARMVCASESEHSKRLAESKIKQMTGGDTVVGEFKYEEQFSYVPTYKIWLRTNYKPRVVGTDDGIWDRTKLIAFTAYFDDEHKDAQLGDKLKAEASGILNWLIRGAMAWAEQGLGTPACIKDTTAEYRKDQNVLGQFLDECCVVHPGKRVEQGSLYKAYKLWAESSGEFVMTKTEFNERTEMQFERGKSSGARQWKGLALKHEQAFLDDDAKVEAVAIAIQ